MQGGFRERYSCAQSAFLEKLSNLSLINKGKKAYIAFQDVKKASGS